ncbi:MAG TPA: S41 family peptidase [Candidatus Saccharimonadia bacterium]
MERRSRKLGFVVPVLVIALVAFIGGQAAPKIIPPSWVLGHKPLDFESLNDTYDLLERKFDGKLDQTKVIDGARAGVVGSAGDPYTVYQDAKEAKDLRDQLSGTLSGIGAEIGIKNNKLTVISPIAGAPAEKAGLRVGDYIAGIDKKDSSAYTLDEAVAKIRGKGGTKVTLTVVRGSSQPIEITITRAVINVPSVTWSMKEGSIGYIKISTFGDDTTEKMKIAAGELKSQGAKSIILDVRNDPGGYLHVAVDVVSQFVPEGKVVVDERHNGRSQQKLTSEGGGLLEGLPVVVLINGGSASASEIVAGALRDNIKAKLVGEKSFGKGSVQDIVKLEGGAQLKITVAHWFTPSGKGIDRVGIKPDIEVKQTLEDFSAGRDPQLNRALQELKK